MADYWKSNAKKYCDFCKCWTADNKASVDFHERGKNHQANVKRRLGEIKKNSIAKRKLDEDSKKMFDNMEKAALSAVQHDINNMNMVVGKSDLKNIVAAHSQEKDQESTYPWSIMVGPQEFSYYYNSLTGQSTWQMPEVFKKIEEKKKKLQQEEAINKLKPPSDIVKNVSKDPYRKSEPTPEKVHSVHPLLGGWSTVRQSVQDDDEPSESVNGGPSEDVAEQKEQNIEEVKDKKERETGKTFKERVMKTTLVTSDEPVAFKKRKFGPRNVRKRDDND